MLCTPYESHFFLTGHHQHALRLVPRLCPSRGPLPAHYVLVRHQVHAVTRGSDHSNVSHLQAQQTQGAGTVNFSDDEVSNFMLSCRHK
jgi:hypothetical protein